MPPLKLKGGINHPNMDHQIFKSGSIKRLGQQISHILICVNLQHLYQVLLIGISDEMMPNLNMLGPVMKDRIFYNANGTLIVYEDFGVHEVEPII